VPSSGQVGPNFSGDTGFHGVVGPTQGPFADPGITGTQSFSQPGMQFGWGLNSFAPAQTNPFGMTPAEVAAMMNANNMMGYDAGGNGTGGGAIGGGIAGGDPGGGYGFGIGPGPGGENSPGGPEGGGPGPY